MVLSLSNDSTLSKFIPSQSQIPIDAIRGRWLFNILIDSSERLGRKDKVKQRRNGQPSTRRSNSASPTLEIFDNLRALSDRQYREMVSAVTVEKGTGESMRSSRLERFRKIESKLKLGGK
jgi:hypothetical protein